MFDGRDGVHSAQGSYSPSKKTNVARSELPVYQRQAFRAPLVGEGAADGKTAGTTFFEDDSVRIWHQNDDVLILSFKTKMHVIGQGVIDGMNKAIEPVVHHLQQAHQRLKYANVPVIAACRRPWQGG